MDPVKDPARQPPGRRPHANRPGARPNRLPDKFLFGWHPVRAALLNPERPVHRLMCLDAAEAELAQAVADAKAAGIDRPAPQVLTRQRLERLVPPAAVHQGVVVEIGPLPPTDLDDLGRMAETRAGPAVVVALDHVTDPHNVGAVIRSAASFGALGVLVSDRHAPEVTGTLARSASGGIERVPLVRVVNLAAALDTLAGWGFRRIGLDEHADAAIGALPALPRAVLV
ncbi:MAG: RNA methyltransferase, partial [Rhodospirillaceae bacterium]|nr:RNA methyltransferase [Rhodospirillaceae bacterium]